MGKWLICFSNRLEYTTIPRQFLLAADREALSLAGPSLQAGAFRIADGTVQPAWSVDTTEVPAVW